MNSALAVCGRSIVSMQVSVVPLQSPPHCLNEESANGAPVSFTFAPIGKLFLQVAPQSMPVGSETTAPLPAPVFITIRSTGIAQVAFIGACVPSQIWPIGQAFREKEAPVASQISIACVPSAAQRFCPAAQARATGSRISVVVMRLSVLTVAVVVE